ncbi:MAG TPA: branched-chain amino acid ABC transporter permease [Solirubrobacteraceae bacterium]|nr:branched-chain amino acid ABC transporter permease [Solirubrobacteraceae bacterium]
MSYYLSTVAVYFGVDLMAAWALNMQFGWAGVPNFAFIIFQAAGAYTAAAVSLGPDTGANAFQHYILGAQLPFPVPLLVAALAGGVVSAVVGLLTLRRLRRDYQAAVFLLIAVIASDVVAADVNLFNGSNGLAAVPQPLAGLAASLGQAGWQWAYAGFVAVICIGVALLSRRLGGSGWQRALRAARDDEVAASALGLHPPLMRMQVFMIGGVIAGLSGGLLVMFISAWSPGAWQYSETFAVLTGIILGGVSNDWGVLIGTFLVQVLFVEVPSFLPQIGYPGLIDALVWVLIGVMWLLVLFFRPSGIWPERRRRVLSRLRARAGAGGR